MGKRGTFNKAAKARDSMDVTVAFNRMEGRSFILEGRWWWQAEKRGKHCYDIPTFKCNVTPDQCKAVMRYYREVCRKLKEEVTLVVWACAEKRAGKAEIELLKQCNKLELFPYTDGNIR